MQKLRKLNFFDRTALPAEEWFPATSSTSSVVSTTGAFGFGGSSVNEITFPSNNTSERLEDSIQATCGGESFLFFGLKNGDLVLVNQDHKHQRFEEQLFAKKSNSETLQIVEFKEDFVALICETQSNGTVRSKLKFFRVVSSATGGAGLPPAGGAGTMGGGIGGLPGVIIGGGISSNRIQTLHEVQVFPDKRYQKPTCMTIIGNHCIAVGSDGGQMMLIFRPFTKNPITRYVSVYQGTESGRADLPRDQQSPDQRAARTITGCHFMGDKIGDCKFRIILFVTTLRSILSYKVGEVSGLEETGVSKGVANSPGGSESTQAQQGSTPDRLDPDRIAILHEDNGEGSDFNCSCVFPANKQLLVAREEGVFSYDPDEGNLSAVPLDGRKTALISYRQAYFVCVTMEDSHAVKDPGAFHSTLMGEQHNKHSQSDAPKCRVTVCLNYHHVRFIAYSAPFLGVKSLFPAFDSSVCVVDKNALFQLKEKSRSEGIDLLLRKRLFDWAAVVAEREGLDAGRICEIYKVHGDALHEKKLYDQALSIYMKTIELNLPLESSYVIEKYLDCHKIGHIATYLRKLHTKPGLADHKHTELLFKCYVKDNAGLALDEFIDEIPIANYEFRIALRVLENTPGFQKTALKLAKKAKEGNAYVRLLLDSGDTSMALGFLKQKTLPIEIRFKILLVHGAQLLAKYPIEVNRLIMECVTGKKLTEDELDNVLTVYFSTGGAEDAAAHGTGASHVREEFLREMMKNQFHYPSIWIEKTLLPTLLEVLLRNYFHLNQRSEARLLSDVLAKKNAGSPLLSPTDTTAKAPAMVDAPISETTVRNAAQEIKTLLEENSTKTEFLRAALSLCGMYQFHEGFLFTCEKLGLYQTMIAYHKERRDFEGLLQTCRRCGAKEPSLWAQALSILTTQTSFVGPTATMSPIKSTFDTNTTTGAFLSSLDNNRPIAPTAAAADQSLTEPQKKFLTEQMIPEVLEHTENAVAPIQLLSFLSSNNVPLGSCKRFLKKCFAKLDSDREDKLTRDRIEIQKMQHELDNMKSKPRIFSASKCYECGLLLECPSVHFFCGHSYHKYCVLNESYTECPKCSITIRRPDDLETGGGCVQVDEFYKYLKAGRNNDAGYPIIASYFGRNLFSQGQGD